MCVSVPQIPTAATRTRISYGEICGPGTSRTSSWPTSTSTNAFIDALSATGENLSLAAKVLNVFPGCCLHLNRTYRTYWTYTVLDLFLDFQFNVTGVQT